MSMHSYSNDLYLFFSLLVQWFLVQVVIEKQLLFYVKFVCFDAFFFHSTVLVMWWFVCSLLLFRFSLLYFIIENSHAYERYLKKPEFQRVKNCYACIHLNIHILISIYIRYIASGKTFWQVIIFDSSDSLSQYSREIACVCFNLVFSMFDQVLFLCWTDDTI